MSLTIRRQVIWVVCGSTSGLQLSACVGRGSNSVGSEEAVHVRNAIFSREYNGVNVFIHEWVVVYIGLRVAVSHASSHNAS